MRALPQTLATVATVVVAMIATTLPAVASHDVQPARIAGEDRYATAAEIATYQYEDGTDRALIARAGTFPDALAAAPAARELDAPVLLANRDAVPQATGDALQTLGVSQVTLLGGTNAISEDVADELARERDVQVDRIAGETRYGTAAEVARFVQQRNGNGANFPGGQRAAFLAYGGAFPDALAASAPAASREDPIPILLTRFNALPQATESAIRDLDLDLVIIVGGPQAVASEVQERIEEMGVNTDRVYGDTRSATAAEIADFAIEYLDFDPAGVELARGDTFPDALAIGPQTGATKDPILLTSDSDTAAAATQSWLATHCPDVDRVRAVGGEEAVTPSVLEKAERSAETCHRTGDQGQQDYGIGPSEPVERQPGESQRFSLFQVYEDGTQVSDLSVDIVLFGCDDIDEPRDATWVFDDANDDDHADGIESTDTGRAVITEINGQDVRDAKGYRDVTSSDGEITATVTSDAADCVDIVFFTDENDNSALDLNAEDRPVEPWGFTEAAWN